MNENSILIWLQFGVLWNVWNVWVTVECVERLSVECPWCLRVCGLPGMSLCLWNVWVSLECLGCLSVECLECLWNVWNVWVSVECLSVYFWNVWVSVECLECPSVCGMPGMSECLWNVWNVSSETLPRHDILNLINTPYWCLTTDKTITHIMF